jgi:dihydroxyacetone kinase-like protein
MVTSIGMKELVWMMEGAVEGIRKEHESLSALDSAIGDGDHGTTMLRAVNQMDKAMKERKSDELQPLLQDMAWALLGIDGGATGPLLGTWCLGMSEAVAGKKELDGKALAVMFEGGLAALKKQTKAQVGDKTMLDALVPAVEALRGGAETGQSIDEMLQKAADAASQGALSTKNLRARVGRAKNLGERSLGYQDPGATSMALMFRGFLDGLVRQRD